MAMMLSALDYLLARVDRDPQRRAELILEAGAVRLLEHVADVAIAVAATDDDTARRRLRALAAAWQVAEM